MNIALWIVQSLLVIIFLMSGVMKIARSRMELQDMVADRMAWVNDFSDRAVRAIGVLEFLGAIGLVLPAGLGILPWLTPLAAVGLALLMLGAISTHWRRREMRFLDSPVVLLALAAFVAYGRFVLEPFA